MTLQDASYQLIERLAALYERSEAAAITNLVMENLTGLDKAARSSQKMTLLSPKQQRQLNHFSTELLQHRPVQYVLEEAWFGGMKFYVDEQVLIPRPETEELVEWIIRDLQKTSAEQLRILDIGTGSGCIPVTLKKCIPTAEISAGDISREALQIAARNAQENETEIRLIEVDVLNKEEWKKLPQIDIIVSNPPYIPLKDRESMQAHVIEYEPALALFVPDEDPLVFYRTIAELAIAKKASPIYFEIHEEQQDAIIKLLKELSFKEIEIRRDMQGKDRMVKAIY